MNSRYTEPPKYISLYSSYISPNQCYYYLSLLKQFVETVKDMSKRDLRIFLVCTEYRYFKFSSLDVISRHTLPFTGRQIKNQIIHYIFVIFNVCFMNVKLMFVKDVAFFRQFHKLHQNNI